MTQAPRLQITPGPCAPDRAGEWQVSWTVAAAAPLELLEIWLPHDHFQSPRCVLDPPLWLEPGHSAAIERPVICHDPPGAIVENAFLILRVGWGEERWRVFARLTVHVNGAGVPEQTCEAVTVQQVRGQ